jgi:phage portal protein BeeE
LDDHGRHAVAYLLGPGVRLLSFTIGHPRAWLGRGLAERQTTISLDEYASWFSFNNLSYPFTMQQTLTGDKIEVGRDFAGLALNAFKQDGIVFACEMCRLRHFTEARFKFRNQRNGRPGDLFGTPALGRLEKPWTGGTTGDLLAMMLLHADIAGNAFVKREGAGVSLLRPDWVTIIAGSNREIDNANLWDTDAQVLGYAYTPGGPSSGRDPEIYMAEEVAHFAPIPDPMARWRGMSWLHPVVTDIIGDRAASQHKVKFFENGATPNIIVSLDLTDPDKFAAFVDIFREKFEGSENAYRTMFLGAGADPKIVGADFRQIDFKATVGVSETRIAAAAGTPPVIVGLSEGLQGSSLNQGNYAMARRMLADGLLRHLWRNAAGSLAQIVEVPPGSELWYDERDIAFLREDAKDSAEVKQAEAGTMQTLVNSGFTADSVVAAVQAGDWSLLVHTGLVSVQLQEPGVPLGASSNGNGAGALVPAGTT